MRTFSPLRVARKEAFGRRKPGGEERRFWNAKSHGTYRDGCPPGPALAIVASFWGLLRVFQVQFPVQIESSIVQIIVVFALRALSSWGLARLSQRPHVIACPVRGAAGATAALPKEPRRGEL